ncbi:unnamed protein product, partial [Prorocentrum cordatum]
DVYQTQLERALVTVQVDDEAALRRLVANLEMNEKVGGMVTTRAMPEFRLGNKFLLIENEDVPDIYSLSEVVVPAQILFFNTSNNQGLDRVCALFQIRGVSIETLCVDGMHVMDLGIVQFVLGYMFWVLVKNNFARSTKGRAAQRHRECLIHLRRRIRSFYLQTGANQKRGSKSMVGRLTFEMFLPTNVGSRALVPLLPLLCRENVAFLGPRSAHFVQACFHLAAVYRAQATE